MLSRPSRYWKAIVKGMSALEKGDFIKEKAVFTQDSQKWFGQLFAGGKHSSHSGHIDQLLVGSLFSKAIGNNLPSSIYLSQSFIFHRQALLSEPLSVLVQVSSINPTKKRLQLTTTILSQPSGQILVSGTAQIWYPLLTAKP